MSQARFARVSTAQGLTQTAYKSMGTLVFNYRTSKALFLRLEGSGDILGIAVTFSKVSFSSVTQSKSARSISMPSDSKLTHQNL